MKIGAIFGWDGVIVNSSSQHDLSWQLLAKEENLDLPDEYFRKGFGMKNELIIPNILQWTEDRDEIRRLSHRKEILYREILASSEIEPCTGVVVFLKMMRDRNIPCAIATSAEGQNIELIMERLELGYFFDAIVCGEDVIESLPDPQAFLIAAQRLGCSPAHCVVFEDAPAGIAAARAGGMKSVGVATTHPVYELTGADIVVQRLDKLGHSRLIDLFAVRAEQAF